MEYIQLRQMIAKYSYHWDSRDVDGIINLFTKDCKLEFYKFGGSKPYLTIHGHKELEPFLKTKFEKFKKQNLQTRHHQENLLINSITDNTASTQNMILMTQQEPFYQYPLIMASGVYYDDWKKIDNNWKFHHRVFKVTSFETT